MNPNSNPGECTFRFLLKNISAEGDNSETDRLVREFRLSRQNPEFDYAGVHRPVGDVACTFLEAQPLPSETVVIAIGDSVLPNPLPVLCIRHYLRRNTPREIAPPAIVVGRMNEIVYDCCRERSCLSCFYAQYTPGSRVLRYVNAGHGAPVLIRRNPEEVLLLDGGGPVFGLQESPVYMERVVRLRIGDRLVAFTHGVVEALADRNPRSAESLLISLVRRNRRLKAIDLANQIIRECEHLRWETRLDQSVFVASLEDLIPSSYGTAAMHAQLGLVVV